MTARGIAIAVIAAGVIAGGVALAIAVNADVGDPEGTAHDKVGEPPKPAAPPAPPAASRDAGRAPPTGAARPALTGSAAPDKQPIPAGGFAAWTGREGLPPGEIEEIARIAGTRIPVALEQRRTALLEQRTSDPAVLAEVLGREPTGFMLATIGTQAKLMRDAAAQAQAQNREGKTTDDAAIRSLRAAQDTYRQTYQRVTGLSDEEFDRFFAPDRPLP